VSPCAWPSVADGAGGIEGGLEGGGNGGNWLANPHPAKRAEAGGPGRKSTNRTATAVKTAS
ncbi:MAG: hypothetical protein ACK5PF_06445, partial [bacterium]